MFVGWLLNVPATCECISGTDLLRQFTCCHTEIEVADQTFYLTQSQYTDTGPTSPNADPMGWVGEGRAKREVLSGDGWSRVVGGGGGGRGVGVREGEMRVGLGGDGWGWVVGGRGVGGEGRGEEGGDKRRRVGLGG